MEKQAPLSEQAFQILRNEILGGGIVPGAQLKLDQLSRRHGFSSSPLREALNRLVSEGMATSEGKRGFFAAQISVKEMEDISRLRLLLDAMALQESIDAGDDLWEGGVLSAYHQMERMEARLPDGDSYSSSLEWAGLYGNYFSRLLNACGSPKLMQIRDTLFHQSERYRLMAAREQSVKKSKLGELKKLMNAAIDRDNRQALSILKKHIEQSTAPVIKYISANQ